MGQTFSQAGIGKHLNSNAVRPKMTIMNELSGTSSGAVDSVQQKGESKVDSSRAEGEEKRRKPAKEEGRGLIHDPKTFCLEWPQEGCGSSQGSRRAEVMHEPKTFCLECPQEGCGRSQVSRKAQEEGRGLSREERGGARAGVSREKEPMSKDPAANRAPQGPPEGLRRGSGGTGGIRTV